MCKSEKKIFYAIKKSNPTSLINFHFPQFKHALAYMYVFSGINKAMNGLKNISGCVCIDEMWEKVEVVVLYLFNI